MAAALQLSGPQAVCQPKRRQQLSEIIGRWRCSNPDSRPAVGAYGSIKVITAESGLYLGDQQGVNGLQQQGYVCVAARRELSAG